MLKRLTVAVAALLALATQSFSAGVIPYSLSQQFDELGNPLSGCFLYLIQAGTVSTPQNGYQDSALTLVLPNPLRCDAAGRLPQFFLADGSIKVRLTKSNGVNVVTADGILVVGPSGGGGGGSPVDPTTVLATGDVKGRYGVGNLAGFVRLNGRTIGSVTSGATERANADTQALFEYFWNTDAGLVVSGGRGVSSIADWTANKTITLPDFRLKLVGGLADMGNTTSTLMSTCVTSTTLGTDCGVHTDLKTLTQANLPSVNFPDNLTITNDLAIANTMGIANTLGITDPGHTHTVGGSGSVMKNVGVGGSNVATTSGTSWQANSSIDSHTTGVTISGGISLTGAVGLTGGVGKAGVVSSGGSGTGFAALPPMIMITWYAKL